MNADNDRLFIGLARQQCSFCPVAANLIPCDVCKAVSYCSPAHQSADKPNHRDTCHAIKTTKQKVVREETALRAMPGDFGIVEDLFTKHEGDFWGNHDTRDYMKARFAHVEALLKNNNFLAVEQALGNLMDMLRLCRSDNMGLRDIVPGFMLRLGREQECYDFLKWWAVVSADDNYDWGDTTLPFLDIRNADPLESIDVFRHASLSLSQLVTATLLKSRLLLDLKSVQRREYNNAQKAFHWPDLYSNTDENDHLSDNEISDLNRPLGKFVKARVRSAGKPAVPEMIERVKAQYHELIKMVQDANPFFWEALVAYENPLPPAHFSRGSQEEADLTLHQCKTAWEESGFASMQIDCDTAKYVGVYHSPSIDVVAEHLPVNRGTGRVLPSVFKPPTSKTTPADLFTLDSLARGAAVRFLHRSNPSTILLYVDGACINNGQSESCAGWAVVYGPDNDVSGRLEEKGPFGDKCVATSNRAELRAAIAALRLSNWRADGVENIIMATDSSYVVDGATAWADGWFRKGWKTRAGEEVKNKDLWEFLLGEVERWKDEGLTVKLWKIPRELNTEADKAAKAAADTKAMEDFKDVAIGWSGVSLAQAMQGGDRRVLVICVEDDYLWDGVFGDLHEEISSKAKVEMVTGLEQAIEVLSHDSAPSIILVGDAAISRQKKLFESVADRLRAGATVVLCGSFSSSVNSGEFSRVFSRLGLPWSRSSYYRDHAMLRPDAVGTHLSSQLPKSYSQKANYVGGVEKSAAWYTAASSSDETAVAFVKVGYGRLGYIGDVNGEEESTPVVLAMCGLLD